MASGEKCPRCQAAVPWLASYCPQCGADLAKPKKSSSGFGKAVRGFAGFGFFLFAAGGFWVHRSESGGPAVAQISPATEVNQTAQPFASPTSPGWHDGSDPQRLPASYLGRSYTVGPDEWTIIDVRPLEVAGRQHYEVRLEGLAQFRARPDGDARREFFYPDSRGRSAFEMSGRANTYWVKSTDGQSHQVQVKYVRVSG
jgi:ribosomal protein L40E